MKRTKALLAALSALCVTFSAMVSVSAADEPQSTTGAQSTEVNQTQYGACIDDNYYLNWYVAMSCAKKGQTIKVLEDYTDGAQNFGQIMWFTNTFNLTDQVILDLNGHTIDLENRYLTVPSSLKITDSSENKTGEIISNYETMYVSSTGDLELDGVTVTSENNPVKKDDSDNGIRYGTIINQGNLTINNSTVTGGYEAIEIDGGKVTINGESTNIEGKGFDAIYIHDEGAELTINDGIIKGAPYYAIVGAGDNSSSTYLGGTKINIKGGNISAEKGTAIYLPQYGEVNIEGGSITGYATAIEIASGTLNITGGEFKSTSTDFSLVRDPELVGSGSLASGSAIAIVCRSKVGGNQIGGGGYYGDMDINISDGTFTGECGIAKYLIDGKDEATSIKNMNITGGTFNGNRYAVYVDDFCKDNNFISGGTFNTDVTSYLADGTAYSTDEKGYTVYSAGNKITCAGTYRTAVDEDGKYDQLTMAKKEFTESINAKDISFNITMGDKNTDYAYTSETTFTDATVLFGLIVTDIPEDDTVTVTLN